MALSLEAEQRLRRAKLLEYFAARQVELTAAAQSAYDYAKETFPQDAIIRRDDVAGLLRPVLAVNDHLRSALDSRKLTQKYWLTYFTDLIIDRTWEDISQ